MKLIRQIVQLIVGGIISLSLYVVCIGIYTKISNDPIIFFASVAMAIIIPVIVCIIIGKVMKQKFDAFTLILLGIIYAMAIAIFAVFGPTFIDRSISYHLAFYAVEEKNVNIEDIQQAFSEDIFDKRLHDAIETGFLSENDDGTLTPTIKSKIMYYLLKPLGELTGSMDTYYDMKAVVDKD